MPCAVIDVGMAQRQEDTPCPHQQRLPRRTVSYGSTSPLTTSFSSRLETSTGARPGQSRGSRRSLGGCGSCHPEYRLEIGNITGPNRENVYSRTHDGRPFDMAYPYADGASGALDHAGRTSHPYRRAPEAVHYDRLHALLRIVSDHPLCSHVLIGERVNKQLRAHIRANQLADLPRVQPYKDHDDHIHVAMIGGGGAQRRGVQNGDQGEVVCKIQQRLNAVDCGPIDEDGKFGPNTTKAVRRFQARSVGKDGAPLATDGIVGDKTWLALFGTPRE